jgi:DNA-binding response OmpR family regulator
MDAAKHRVLFVDDDADMCALAEIALAARGFTVEWCTSEEQALALLSRDSFDVVVTDLRLGAIGGIGLCERIRADRPQVPVLVLSGDAAGADAARRAGARTYLLKPVEMDTLAGALTEVLTRGAAGAEA